MGSDLELRVLLFPSSKCQDGRLSHHSQLFKGFLVLHLHKTQLGKFFIMERLEAPSTPSDETVGSKGLMCMESGASSISVSDCALC